MRSVGPNLSNLWASYGYLRSTLPARPSEIRQDAEIQHRAMEIRSTRLLIGRAIFPRKLAKFCWQGRRRANTDRGSSFATIFAHTSHHLLQVNKKDGLHLRHHRRRARLRGPHQQAVSYGRQTPSGNFGFCDALGAAVRCFVRPDGVRARLRLVARHTMRRGTRAGTMRRACRIVARLSSANSRATRTLARVSERDRGARRVGTPRMQNNPDRHPHRNPERELTTTFPFPPRYDSETVKASAAKPAIVEKVEKLGKAALSGLAASAMLASVRPRLNNDIPRGRERSTVSARARPDARGERGPTMRGDPLRRLFILCFQPGPRARARGAARARFSPRPARGFHLSHWLVARRGTAVQFYPAARRPVPRPTVRASLTRRYPPSFPSSSSPVRERRHLRRVPGPHLPPGEGHRPCQHLPRRRDWRVRL